MKSKISVIIPVYNASAFLEYTVRSILNQTCSSFELLLIDDGSTDDSLHVCNMLAKADARIRVFHQENGGVSSARNLGLEKAAGTYIAFVDADDIVAPDYLERLLLGMQSENVVLSMCTHVRIHSSDDALSTVRTNAMLFTAKQCAERLLNGRFPVCVCGGLFNRERIGKLRFPVGIRNNEDKFFLFCFLVANENRTVAFTNDRLYGYLVRDGSATRSAWNGSADVIWVADRILELTAAQHPEWTNQARNDAMFARVATMTSIVRASASENGRKTYERLKREVFEMGYPKTGSHRLKVEYCALKCGDIAFRLLVKGYYALYNDERRFRLNEKQTSMVQCKNRQKV